jgi:cytochrome oxidase Cu insertion factor (SCO1/SenC/PrrC family)
MNRILAAAFAAAATAALASATPGSPAPAFTLTDLAGKPVNLADYKGRTVVLEWHNFGCPFVQKHYRSGNMQALQQKWTAQGVVWLTLISSAPGTQGFVTGKEANDLTVSRKAAPTAVLFDPTGKTGHAYDATHTPHMFVVSRQGELLYMGGIDDKATTDLADVPKAKPYVDIALTEIAAGKPVSLATTRAYGCTIKYAS